MRRGLRHMNSDGGKGQVLEEFTEGKGQQLENLKNGKPIKSKAEIFKRRIKKDNKARKYEMWITYNSNKKRLQFPVLPEKIEISYPSRNDTVYVYGVGEVTVKKHPGAFVIKFSSFFPAKPCQGSIRKPKAPKKCKEFLEKIMEIDKPAKFIFTGSPCRINTLCTIDFNVSEQGGDIGTIYYDITITEYKKVSVRKIKLKKSENIGKAGTNEARADTEVKDETYVVKSGDCLWNIAIQFYGNGAEYVRIYEANKQVIGSNPNLIYPGQVLTIPK